MTFKDKKYKKIYLNHKEAGLTSNIRAIVIILTLHRSNKLPVDLSRSISISYTPSAFLCKV